MTGQTTTLATATATFLRAKRRRLAESSYREYARVMEKMCEDLGEDRDVKTLEPPRGTEVVEQFLDDRWGATPHAYNRNLSVVRGFMKFLLQREYLIHDPCAPLERAKPEKHARSTFTDEDVRHIVECAETARDRVALRLLLVYGLRKGALTNLQLVCFDFDHRVLSFKTKGRKYHVIPIASDEIWTDMERIIYDAQPTDYLLHRRGKPSEPLSPHGVHCWWYHQLERADVVTEGTTSGQRMHKARHALAVDTPILTTDGWKTMQTICVGDAVYASDGTPTTVLETSPVFDAPCFEVELSDGSILVATADHRWWVFDTLKRPDGQWVMLTTDDLIQNYQGWNGNRYRVACNAVIESNYQELPIDPYIFGYWLGDGNAASADITVGINDLAHLEHAVARAGYEISSKLCIETTWGRGWRVHLVNNQPRGDTIKARLSKLGVLNNKHIPDGYSFASPDQRRELLAGLIDSDGSVTPGRVAIKSKNVVLAQHIFELARSLGLRASIRWSVSDELYVIGWTPMFNPARLQRKRDKYIPYDVEKSGGKRIDLMSVVAVRETATVPTRCIFIEHPSHVFLAGRTFVPTGNTAGQRVLNSTGNLKAAQMLLGHASIQTTGDVYVGWDNETLRETMEDLDV